MEVAERARDGFVGCCGDAASIGVVAFAGQFVQLLADIFTLL
jgi:hypothetical protein